MSKLSASVVGGTGYTAGELLRLIYQHPELELRSVSSTSKAGQPFHSAHPDLEGLFDQPFSSTPDLSADVLFLCLGHEVSKPYLEQLSSIPDSLKIIDLSRDFRLQADRVFHGREFIYGLPELNREKIKSSSNVANPGCFATAIELALLRLGREQFLHQAIHISAITGATGAGASLRETSHFAWRNNNVSTYKAFTHQHLGEITESISQLQSNFNESIHFIPMRGDFPRGIFTNIYQETNLSQRDAVDLYKTYYSSHPFVQVSDNNISLKNVVNTNRCFLQVQVIEGRLLIHTAIDNLVKGASGQAIHNMNLLFNLPETTGLQLKPTML